MDELSYLAWHVSACLLWNSDKQKWSLKVPIYTEISVADFWLLKCLKSGSSWRNGLLQNKKLWEKMGSDKLKGGKKMPPATKKKLSAIILACSPELAMPPLTQPVTPLALATQLLRPVKWDKSSGSTFQWPGGWEEKKMSRNIQQKHCVCRLVALNETTGSSSFVYLKSEIIQKKCFLKKLELHLFLFLVK